MTATKRIYLDAAWTYWKRRGLVALTTRHGSNKQALYDLVYPHQNALRLNDRSRTKLRITIEVIDE